MIPQQSFFPATRTVSDSLVPERSGITVWWSNIKREGEWIVPRTFRAFSFMGNTELDLTLAQLSSGVSEIEIRCIMTSIEITVPPDVRVQCDGAGFLGNFDVERIGEVPPPPPGAPTLRITGAAYLGSVTVRILGNPGPSWREKLKASWHSLSNSA